MSPVSATRLPDLPHDEPEDAALAVHPYEVVARDLNPALHVGLGRRAVGEHQEQLTHRHARDGLARLDDGHRTEQPRTVDARVRIEDFGRLCHNWERYRSGKESVKEAA